MARSPRASAVTLGPQRAAGRPHRRRCRRPLPRRAGGRPPDHWGPPAPLDHGPAPEPGRGARGSPLAGLGELRRPPGSWPRHPLRVAAGRHRPHGVPPARPRSPSRLPLPFRHRCRWLPQLRAGADGHSCRGPGGLLHRRHDPPGRADLAGTPGATPGRERSELRHGGIRAGAGAARAEGARAGPPPAAGRGGVLRRQRPAGRGAVRELPAGRRPTPLLRARVEVQGRDRALRPALPDEPLRGRVRAPRRSKARASGPVAVSRARGLQRRGSHLRLERTSWLRP